jgi:hypothetical protein
MGPTQAPIQSVLWGGGVVKRQDCEVDRSPSTSTKAKNTWSDIWIPLTPTWHGVILSKGAASHSLPERRLDPHCMLHCHAAMFVSDAFSITQPVQYEVDIMNST